MQKFTVQTRSGVKVFTSPYSNKEAWGIASSIQGNSLVESFRQQVARGKMLSPKQGAWVHLLAVEEMERREAAGRKPSSPAPQAVPQTAVPVAGKGEMDGVLGLFREAQKHLKRPKLLVAVPQDGKDGACTPYVLSVAGIRSKNPGHINVVREKDDTWVGRIDLGGILNAPRGLTGHPGLVEQLRRLALDPARVAREYGKLLGVCCFCGRRLEDPKSTSVGYGPVCAQHWGLPWGEVPAPQAASTPITPKPSLPQVKTAALKYDSKSRTFTCDASDIGWSAGTWPKEVEVVSGKTGAAKVFVARRPELDADGDLRWVDYWCEDLVLRCYND